MYHKLAYRKKVVVTSIIIVLFVMTFASQFVKVEISIAERSRFTKVIHFIKSKDILKVEMKPNLMTIVNPSSPKFVLTFNTSYRIENEHFCASVSNLTIFVIVLSSPKHLDRRMAIRVTWGDGKAYSSYGTIKVLFLLGATDDSAVQDNIKNEFNQYRDILQGNVFDSYRNLSHKSVMGYKWAMERCTNAKYIIKTDDDIVLNMFRIFQTIVPEMSLTQYHVNCRRLYKEGINRIGEKNVSSNQFEGQKFYPSFCSGQYVMMLNDIVPYLLESASKSPFFWVDDVFMYGIVMNNIPSLEFKQIKPTEYGKDLTTEREWQYVFRETQDVTQLKAVWSIISNHYQPT